MRTQTHFFTSVFSYHCSESLDASSLHVKAKYIGIAKRHERCRGETSGFRHCSKNECIKSYTYGNKWVASCGSPLKDVSWIFGILQFKRLQPFTSFRCSTSNVVAHQL